MIEQDAAVGSDTSDEYGNGEPVVCQMCIESQPWRWKTDCNMNFGREKAEFLYSSTVENIY